MNDKINIGILGCANIAERFLIPAINDLEDNFILTGIASRAEKKADLFANEFNTKAFYSYEALLNVENLEAVYIPLPNSLHYGWIKKSLQNGLHVLAEKSLVCSYKEAIELNNIAKDNNLVLMENFQFRFHHQLKYIKGLVDNGEIGELRNMRSAFGFPPFSDQNNIRYKDELGGGALLDAGAYVLKISQIFLGDDIFVDSASLYQDKEKGVDTWGSGYLKQKKGNVASQIAFGFDHYYQNSIELWGSKGKISTNRIFTAAPGFEPTIELETAEGKEIIKLDSDHHFKNMLLYFYHQIKTKDKVENEYDQNINQARLIRELREKSSEQ